MSDNSERAVRAQQLLDDEVLEAAMKALEEHAIQMALQANTFDPNEAISALCHLKAAHAIRPQLQSLITTGKLEDRRRLSVA